MAPPPPPTESQILSSYLLTPASLPTILPLDHFRSLFPQKLRSHPHIKPLYRDLQFLRSVDIDVVRENIVQEVRKGDRMKVEMWRAYQAGQNQRLKGAAIGGTDGGVVKDEETEEKETELDTVLFGQTGSVAPRAQYHSMESLLEEMEKAAEVMEMEAESAEREAKVLVEEIREIIGGLSDLRYGSFARKSGSGDVGEEVQEALGRLREVCENGGG